MHRRGQGHSPGSAGLSSCWRVLTVQSMLCSSRATNRTFFLFRLPGSQMLATSTFALKRWDEKPYDEADGAPKLTRASVLYEFEGEMSGEGRLEYLMTYLPDGSAVFVGYQRFVGRVGGRDGSFIFQHGGRFANGVASDAWTVVAGSGTGALSGIRGQIEFSAAHQDRYEIIFDYDVA